MLTLFLCGDVMTGRGIDQILAHPAAPQLHEPYINDARQYVELAKQANGDIATPVDDRHIWGIGLEAMREIDPAIRLINLETAVTDSDRFWEGKGIHYRMSPDNFGCITSAGIDCVTLANNHVLDWGYSGLTETLRVVDEAGLKVTGAGVDVANATAPAVLHRLGQRVFIFGVAASSSGVPTSWAASENQPGIALLNGLSTNSFTELADRIEAARTNLSDIVVVSIHWGGNWGYEIPPEQRMFAHRLIEEAGVDLVHGHSSHHVKGIEVHRQRLILYGCGDLITDYEGISGHERYRGDLGLIYFSQLDPLSGRLEAMQMQPTQLRQMQLAQPAEKDVRWLRTVLNREGRHLGTHVTLEPNNRFQLHWEP